VPNLEFTFSEFQREIEAIQQLADNFISKESTYVLHQLKQNLVGIRGAAAGHVYSWGIPENGPLVTKDSEGEYEPSGRGRHKIFASITSVWEIKPLGPSGSASRVHRKFALTGIASTRIRLIERLHGGEVTELAMWRMEVGDEASPGCHFHVQVLGTEQTPPFPNSLSVPPLRSSAV